MAVRVGLVGYGEVGRILAEDLRLRGVAVVAYDLKLADDRRAPLVDHAGAHGVRLVADHVAVAQASDLVISAVTADQAVAVADAVAGGLAAGTWVLDVNSASPGAKQRAAAVVDAAGGRYVEGAVMTTVPPYRSAVPILLGGPHARPLEPVLHDLGLTGAVFHDERLGVASATKLCRSVVIKGMEALFVESLVAARHHGVEDAVLTSLAETFPGLDWDARASHFFSRAVEHARRRAEEMGEAAETVAAAGLEPLLARATARRMADLADLADAGVIGPTPDWRATADALLTHRPHEEH
ncbi:MAG TPA: DUF1932 domain-containing protein [Dermatophilaceae bacterium]|jgi:3-hydroxyisobutyrate dehydrogenase-like beta-hydroxyacid dehydrogenase